MVMWFPGSRVNELSHLKISNMTLTDTESTFTFDEVLQTSMEGVSETPLVFRAYPHDPALCPVGAISNNLEERGKKSADDVIFVITVKPDTAAKPDTIANWLKKVLHLAIFTV